MTTPATSFVYDRVDALSEATHRHDEQIACVVTGGGRRLLPILLSVLS